MKRLASVVWICAGVLAIGHASEGRDLSKPSQRLVGHWVTAGGDHVYIGAIDPETEIGAFGWVETSADGRVIKHRYKVISEVPRGEKVTIQILFRGGGDRLDSCLVSKDGMKMTRTITVAGGTIEEKSRYVDSKTVVPEE